MSEISSVQDIVNDIVSNRLGASTVRPYQSTVQAVIDAIAERDNAIAEFLLTKAEEMNLSEQRVRPVLVEAGLLPEPVAELRAVEDEDMPEWAKQIMREIADIKRNL